MGWEFGRLLFLSFASCPTVYCLLCDFSSRRRHPSLWTVTGFQSCAPRSRHPQPPSSTLPTLGHPRRQPPNPQPPSQPSAPLLVTLSHPQPPSQPSATLSASHDTRSRSPPHHQHESAASPTLRHALNDHTLTLEEQNVTLPRRGTLPIIHTIPADTRSQNVTQ